MTTYCIGIDPGIRGAIAVCSDTDLVAVYDMPLISTVQSSGKTLHRIDALTLISIFALYPTEVIAIEAVSARPGEGATSSFNFGHTFGTTETCARLTGTPVRLVTPRVWKRAMGLNGDKNLSRETAQALSGQTDPFRRKKDDGRAEAYLLAQYIRNSHD